MPGPEVGQRIARARRRRGLSQAVLAGLIGRSESWLSQVERGKRTVDSHVVLTRLSEVLRVDIAELTDPASQDDAGPRLYKGAAAIKQAMMRYDSLSGMISGSYDKSSCDAANLTGRTRAAYHRYQATRYEEAGRLIPGLIRDAEAADSDKPDMPQARALVYDTTAALLNRVGEYGLAWVAADRAVAAATQSGQPLLVALSAYRLAYVLPTHRHASEAVEVAMSAAGALERAMTSPSSEYLSIYGGLHLAAASAAATSYDTSLVPTLLQKARAVAERLGEDANFLGTAFGPVNVAIHTLSVSVRLADSRTAVKIGESLDAEVIPPGLIGRRTQVHLDLARAYCLRRHDAAAVNALLAAERLSPQLVRFDEPTRELITGLLHREHRPSTPELRPLARRAGII
jgi:transcriptional regulator with XRE-family HTH domain